MSPAVRYTRTTLLLLVLAVVIGATLLAGRGDADTRTWTDASGAFRIEAEFVDYADLKVQLRKIDGSLITVEMKQLSAADQQHVRGLLKSRRQGGATAATAATTAGDWNQWRGPLRDGIAREQGLLPSWNGAPPIVWQAKNLGKGYSSVAIADGRLFTLGDRRGGAELIALDAKTGEELWATKVGGGEPNGTPTVDGELVYAIGRDGDLLCADSATGREVWRKSFKDDFGGFMMSGWGYSESPLIDGDKLVCTPGGNDKVIVALDKKSGRELWAAKLPSDVGNRGKDGAGYSSIVISNAGGVKQYVQLVGRGIISVEADSGRTLWTYNAIANDTANIPTPIVDGDFVFCSTGYGTGAALLEVARGARGVREVYFLESKTLQNHHGGMILLDGHIYCGHNHNKGLPICVELKTGRVVWGPERGPGDGSAAITLADGKLYFRYENGVMALIDATPQGYRLEGEFNIATVNGKSWPHPVINNRKLYLRDQHDLHCYNIAK